MSGAIPQEAQDKALLLSCIKGLNNIEVGLTRLQTAAEARIASIVSDTDDPMEDDSKRIMMLGGYAEGLALALMRVQHVVKTLELVTRLRWRSE